MTSFFWLIIPAILAMWGMIAWHVWLAFKAVHLDADFFAPAGLAAFASFLFCGPFCVVVWYVLLLRSIYLSHRPARNIRRVGLDTLRLGALS